MPEVNGEIAASGMSPPRTLHQWARAHVVWASTYDIGWLYEQWVNEAAFKTWISTRAFSKDDWMRLKHIDNNVPFSIHIATSTGEVLYFE